MKNFLFILTLLFGMLLFSPQEEVESDNIAVAQKEAVMKEKGSADVQYYLNVLSTDLKESKGLTARRTVQSTNNTFHLRTLKIAEKVLQDIRLKEMNAQRKVLENVSNHKSVYPSLPHGGTCVCSAETHYLVIDNYFWLDPKVIKRSRLHRLR